MTSRLEKIYKEEVVPALMKQFGYTNPMEVPKLTKITLNMGVGEAATNKKIKGQTGEVLRVDGERVYVSNLNLVKRHTKANPQAGQPGGVIEREASIHISNVMLLNPATGKGERVATKVLENGQRMRVFRSSGEAI